MTARLLRRHSFLLFTPSATPELYTLSLHDALPICISTRKLVESNEEHELLEALIDGAKPRLPEGMPPGLEDRKSTRLNSSHSQISYAVFCLKKKTLAQYPHYEAAFHPAQFPMPTT